MDIQQSESDLPVLKELLKAFREQDWTHAKWNGKIVVVPLEDDTYSIYVNGNDGSYRPLLSELTYEHAHDLVDLLNVQDEIKEARSTIHDNMGLPNDLNLLRDHANRGELYALQRANHDLTVKEEDVEIGLRFRDLLDQTAQRKDNVGTEAKRALTYFNTLYEDLASEVAADQADRHRWKLIGYDIRTGTGSASLHNLPNEAAVTQAAVMLAALSGGNRLNSLLPDVPNVSTFDALHEIQSTACTVIAEPPSGGVPAHVKGVNLNKVITMEKEAQDAIKYIGERLPKPDWETARNLVSSSDRKGFVYLAKPNAQYAGKVLMMSDTHLVQQVGKNSAVAHDLSILENGPELERQFDNGEIKAGRTNIKVEYGHDRGKADIVTYNQQRAESVQTQAEKWAEQNITNSKSRETFLKHVRTFAQDMAKGQEPTKTLPDKAKAPEKTQAPQQQQRGR